jgi:uracil-DNA glycosylase
MLPITFFSLFSGRVGATPSARLIADPAFGRLLAEIQACTICAPHLPLGARPIVRGWPSARLLIISQAPGRRVHDTRLSFNDRSGDGDLPPRPECAPRWHAQLRAFLPAIELTLLVGSYAIDYYLPQTRPRSMTEVILRWRDFRPEFFVLPHPSWRSTLWLRANPWFETEVLPELRERAAAVLSAPVASASPAPI